VNAAVAWCFKGALCCKCCTGCASRSALIGCMVQRCVHTILLWSSSFFRCALSDNTALSWSVIVALKQSRDVSNSASQNRLSQFCMLFSTLATSTRPHTGA
jgi:hypothetical protein